MALSVIAFVIRVYSRGFLTRSIGSDDFAIAISTALQPLENYAAPSFSRKFLILLRY